MPSHLHEAIAEILGDSPTLVAELLQSTLGVRLPTYASARRVDAKLTELAISEFRSDGVLRFDDANGVAVAVVILEVQLRKDPEKEWAWPAYVALTRARYRCRTELLVFTTDEATEAWARTPIRLGEENVFRPFVLGPRLVPRIENAVVASTQPELAVLSALAHSRTETDVGVVRAVLEGLSAAHLKGTEFAYYRDVVEQSLSAAVRRALEQHMPYPGYEPQSEVSKAVYRGLAEGKAIGRAEGKAEGEAIGRAEGEAIGRAEGKAESLRLFLRARNIALTAEQQQRINDCSDVAQLDEWIRRATVVSNADQLFAMTT